MEVGTKITSPCTGVLGMGLLSENGPQPWHPASQLIKGNQFYLRFKSQQILVPKFESLQKKKENLSKN